MIVHRLGVGVDDADIVALEVPVETVLGRARRVSASCYPGNMGWSCEGFVHRPNELPLPCGSSRKEVILAKTSVDDVGLGDYFTALDFIGNRSKF